MEQEFEEIYENYASEIYYFLLRMCRNEQLAMDLLQDTMLKAVTSIDKFKGECSIKTYLCTIARNEYCNWYKRAENQNLPLDIVPEQAADDIAFEHLADAEQAMQIHRILHKMDDPYKEVFTLRVFAELKFSEIGIIFGKSENWAGVTFFRAKKKLIQLLEEAGIYEK